MEVRVNYSGIKTTQEVGEIGRNEDVLTRISDVLLKGNEMFTYDSETSNKLNTVKPGDTVEGNMGCVLKDVNGEKITSLEIELQGFVNVSKEDVANELYNDYSFWQYFFTEKQFKDIITSQNDVISSGYGKYLTQKYYLTVEFGADGQFMIKVPEDMPENILLAITAIEDPITGEKVNISEIFRLFVALGNGISSSPDKVPNEDDGHRYFSIGTSYANYADMEPSISGKIYSDKYDVTKGIPTSENIMYQLSADNAIYDITTRTTKVDIGVKDITIILTATYPQKHTKITYDESGEKIEKTWTTTERVSRTLTTKYSYAMPTLTLYDVPISNVFPVQGGLIQTANNGNTLSSGTMGLTGGNVQNAQTIKVT